MKSSESIVHVVDDDDAVRDSVAFLLTSAGIPVATHVSAQAFLQSDPRADRGCIITDVRMPGMSGVDLLIELRNKAVRIPVIVITGHGDVPLAVEAMRLGAVDFIEKPFDDEVLLAAVRSARATQDTGPAFRAAEIRGRIDSLSDRERQVMQGLIEGHANKKIAFDLGISPRTVEIYRANVMTKMQAGSLSELVRMVVLVAPNIAG